jgi:2-keto-4-pentenoate hydratase
MYGRLVKAGREKAVVGFKVAFTEEASANPRQFSRNLFGCLAQFELDTIPVSIAVNTNLLPYRNS